MERLLLPRLSPGKKKKNNNNNKKGTKNTLKTRKASGLLVQTLRLSNTRTYNLLLPCRADEHQERGHHQLLYPLRWHVGKQMLTRADFIYPSGNVGLSSAALITTSWLNLKHSDRDFTLRFSTPRYSVLYVYYSVYYVLVIEGWCTGGRVKPWTMGTITVDLSCPPITTKTETSYFDLFSAVQFNSACTEWS